MRWLGTLRKGVRRFFRDADYNRAIENIKISQSGIRSVDDVFQNIPFNRVDNEVSVNGVKWREVQPDIRRGNIITGLEKMDIVRGNITRGDESALKKLMEPTTPEFKLVELEQNISTAKSAHADLDVRVNSGPELEAKLTEGSKAKVTSYYEKLKTAAKGAVLIAGVFGVLYVTGDMFANLAKAAKERDGCFILRKANDKTSGCKLLNRSCESPEGANACGNNETNLVKLNIHILLKNALLNDPPTLQDINRKLDKTVTKDNINQILSNSDDITKLVEYYDEEFKGTDTANPCEVGDISEGCIACDSSAQTNSIHYVDDSDLPTNYTIQCIRNSTILEALVDIAGEAGVDIIGKVKGALSGENTKWIIIGAVVLLVLVAVGFVVMRFIPKKNESNRTTFMTPPPMSYYNQGYLSDQLPYMQSSAPQMQYPAYNAFSAPPPYTPVETYY